MRVLKSVSGIYNCKISEILLPEYIKSQGFTDKSSSKKINIDKTSVLPGL